MKAVIIDDERLARTELKSLLDAEEVIEIVGEGKNAEEGIELINKLQPDVVFLDIQMPEMDGFEMIRKLDEIPNVIFVTAYDDHAIEAFKHNALDYLLKPVDPNLLHKSIKKLKSSIEENDFESDNSRVSKDILKSADRVFIKDGEKCFLPFVADIRYLESHGNYVRVFFKDHKPLILRSLNSLEERLDPHLFFRANRKYIINLNHIENIENWFNGGLQVTLSSGEQIDISRRQAIRFKDFMAL